MAYRILIDEPLPMSKAEQAELDVHMADLSLKIEMIFLQWRENLDAVMHKFKDKLSAEQIEEAEIRIARDKLTLSLLKEETYQDLGRRKRNELRWDILSRRWLANFTYEEYERRCKALGYPSCRLPWNDGHGWFYED